MIDLMTELLSRMSKINSGPAATSLNQILVNTNFLDLIKGRLKDEDYKSNQYLKFLYNVAVLSDKVIDKFADDTKRIKYNELSEYSDFLKDLIKNGQIENNLDLALKISDVMNDFKEKERHKKMNKFEKDEKERNQINQNIINVGIIII